MTPRTDILRFPFSQADLDRMPDIPGVVDLADDLPIAPGGSVPRALVLVTRVDPPTEAPQVRPLFPGRIRFFADTTAPGALPDPATIVLSEAEHAGWITVGRLMVTVEEKAVTKALDAFAVPLLPPVDVLADPVAAPDIEVAPNVVWYDRVRISWAFLDTTLESLRKEVVKYADGSQVGTGAADWKKHAVAGFLSGTYVPLLRLGADAAADDVARFPMPTVEMDASGTSILEITTARAERPQDYKDEAYETEMHVAVSRDDPVHLRNGPIPARHVLRSLQGHFAETPTGVVAGAVLAGFPLAPRYRPVRFTRTWQPVPNTSIYFNFVIATFTAADGTVVGRGPLPPHGIFYLREDPGSAFPDPPFADVTLAGRDVRWLDGGVGDVWQTSGRQLPVTCDLSLSTIPHVVVRLAMAEAMRVEAAVEGQSLSCTYLSMRRTVRALVDNRICGGRLSFGVGSTAPETLKMMSDAWASGTLGAGQRPSASTLAANNPLPNAEPTAGANALLPVLRAFFPVTVAAQPAGPEASTDRDDEFDGGQAAFHIWQSRVDLFTPEATRSNFSGDHIGRGGAGALVERGLGAFHVDPERGGGESDEDYFDRIVTAMLTGLQPGAVLQFWVLDSDYETIKGRGIADPDLLGDEGHSPVFHSYMTDPATGAVLGLVIYDQHKLLPCSVTEENGKKRMDYVGLMHPQIWIAANWTE